MFWNCYNNRIKFEDPVVNATGIFYILPTFFDNWRFFGKEPVILFRECGCISVNGTF